MKNISLKYLYELGSSMQNASKARLLLGIKLRLLFLKAVNIINWQEIVICLFTLLFAISMVF